MRTIGEGSEQQLGEVHITEAAGRIWVTLGLQNEAGDRTAGMELGRRSATPLRSARDSTTTQTRRTPRGLRIGRRSSQHGTALGWHKTQPCKQGEVTWQREPTACCGPEPMCAGCSLKSTRRIPDYLQSDKRERIKHLTKKDVRPAVMDTLDPVVPTRKNVRPRRNAMMHLLISGSLDGYCSLSRVRTTCSSRS